MSNLFGETDTPSEIYNYYKNSNHQYIEKDIDDLIKKYPSRPEVYILKGYTYKEQDSSLAIKYYKKAIEANPNNSAYYAIIARYLLQVSEFTESIEYFTYLIEHEELLNHSYYASRKGGLRLIASCCIGDWKIANEDIGYIDDDYIYYTKPILGKITKNRLIESVKNREELEIEQSGIQP